MGRTGDVVSKNRYVYVKNNPLKYVDPTGNDVEDLHNVPEPETLEDLNNRVIGQGSFEQWAENSSFVDRATLVISRFALRPVSRMMFIKSIHKNTGDFIFSEDDELGKKAVKKIKGSSEYKKVLKTAVQNANMIGKRVFSRRESVIFVSNKDLSTSIHKAEVNIEGSYIDRKWALDKWHINSSVSDRYDFHWKSDMTVKNNRLNNMIYRDQQNGLVHPYNFNIVFTHEIYNYKYN